MSSVGLLLGSGGAAIVPRAADLQCTRGLLHALAELTETLNDVGGLRK